MNFGHALRRLFVQISIRAQATSVVHSASVPQQIAPSDHWVIDPGLQALSQKQVADFPKHLEVEETAHVLRWIKTLIESQHGMSWASCHQLFVDYHKLT